MEGGMDSYSKLNLEEFIRLFRGYRDLNMDLFGSRKSVIGEDDVNELSKLLGKVSGVEDFLKSI